ncbi:hypothetical protein FI667_g12617, partial [Globisporangium splendens]
MAASNTASTTTMMKEYLKKQLKYWVENFRDDMLPRDFNNVKFSRQQITLHRIVEVAVNSVVPKLRLLLALDELEVMLDNHLFHTVQQLLRSSDNVIKGKQLAERRFRVAMQEFRVTTESKEFVGDAIFVPVLPLAFQMLECTIQGCGCIQTMTSTANQSATKATGDSRRTESLRKNWTAYRSASWWPDRVLAEVKHVACMATSLKNEQQPTMESFLTADTVSVRLSFSDVDDPIFQYVAKLWSDCRGGEKSIVSQTLFLAVLEIRAVEFTLVDSQLASIGGDTNVARMKNLFEFVSVVMNNQLGHLSLQSSLDFRALYNSRRLRFFHWQHEALSKAGAANSDGHEHSNHGQAVEIQVAVVDEEKEPSSSAPDRPLTKQQRRWLRQDSERLRAARIVQRNFRRHVLAQSQSRRIGPRSTIPSQIDEPIASDNGGDAAFNDRIHSGSNSNGKQLKPRLGPHDDGITSESHQKRKDSSSTTSSSSLFGHVSEDLMSPKKMAAAANVLTNFVKAKQQQIESEVVGLATQSKESAARLVRPSYTACKKLFHLDEIGSDKQEPRRESSSSRKNEVDGGDHAAENETRAARTASESSSSSSLTQGDATESMIAASNGGGSGIAPVKERHDSHEKEIEENDDNRHKEHAPIANDEEQQEEEGSAAASGSIVSDEVEVQEVAKEANPEDRAAEDNRREANTDGQEGDMTPASVDEPQLSTSTVCGSRSIRAKVGFLCREIARRFNELFADHHSQKLEHVTLQDVRGGVFALTDMVRFVYRCEDEVLFAVPYQVGARIRCVAHIEPSSSSSSCVSIGKTPRSSSIKTKSPKYKLGTMFSRCSELPLPLVVALLTNERERDLLQCIMRGSSGNDREWPELALNASFLDPTARQMLHAQVCWFENACVRVANPDAFVLCLQQLGLYTSSSRGSNSSSKYVGKILRDRLKMDASNPLIHAACLRSPEFQQQQRNGEAGGDKELESEGEKDAASICYESLEAIVQEDYGVLLQPIE